MRSDARRRLLAACSGGVAVAGLALLILFLRSEGLDRADMWMSVVGGLSSLVFGILGVILSRPRRVTPPATRDRYLRHVAAGGGELLDREPELAAMREFCLGDDPPGYLWWQADAWAGKSALMAWFATHPPAGVEVVSAFVTARDVGQGTRVAFAGRVRAQLAELLGELDAPGGGSAEEELRELYARASAACRARRKRLVLLVDGLDEDQGVTLAADSHSIAALLPDTVPGGLRVIVASRPFPGVPWDVPDRHPLRDPSVVRVLRRSPHAEAVRNDLERELRRLAGDPVDLTVLGLVAAVGGGLTLDDLALLTGADRLDLRMETVTGRTFVLRQPLLAGAGRPPSYAFAHEQLQSGAEREAGARAMSQHRARILQWAQSYAGRGWPDDTPEFLIVGLDDHLRRTGEVAALLRFHTDPRRQSLLRRATGAHQFAIGSLGATVDLLAAEPQPDLAAMARIALHRDALAERSARIPRVLPAVLAGLGEPDRAVALIRPVLDHGGRSPEIGHFGEAKSLIGLIGALARGGHLGHAERLLATVKEPRARISAAAELIPWTDAPRARHLVAEAEAILARLRAEAVASNRVRASVIVDHAAELARAFQAAGEGDAAVRMLRLAEESAATAGANPFVLAELAWSTAVVSPGPLARARISAAEEEMASDTRITDQVLAFAALVTRARLRLGSPEEVHLVREEVRILSTFAGGQHELAADLAMIIASELGDTEPAARLMRELLDTAPATPTPDLLAVAARLAVATGDVEQGRRLADRSEQTADGDVGLEPRIAGLTALAEAASRVGDGALARGIIHRVRMATPKEPSHPSRWDEVHSRLAAAAVEIGDLTLAVDLAPPLFSDEPGPFSGIKVGAGGLEPAGAAALLGRLPVNERRSLREGILRSAITCGRFDVAAAVGDQVAYARALGEAGEFIRATQVLLGTPVSPRNHDDLRLGLARLAARAAAAGRRGDAAALLTEALNAARFDAGRADEEFLWAVASVHAAMGDERAADEVARSFRPTAPGYRPSVGNLVALAGGWIAGGRPDRARPLLIEAAGEVTWPREANAVVKTASRIGGSDLAREITRVADGVMGRAQIAAAIAATAPWTEDESLLAELFAKEGSYFDGRLLTAAVPAAADAGRVDRVRRLAGWARSPESRARLLGLAAERVEPAAARELIAAALPQGRWIHALPALATVRPDAVATLVADFDVAYGSGHLPVTTASGSNETHSG